MKKEEDKFGSFSMKLVTRFYGVEQGFDNNEELSELPGLVPITKGVLVKLEAFGPLYRVEDVELHLYDSEINGKAGFRVFCTKLKKK